MFRSAAVLGAGSWGMAIARVLDANDIKVNLWEYNKEDYEIIKTQRCHPKKLPDIQLADSITLFNNLEEAYTGVDLIVLAIPSQYLRAILKLMVVKDTPVVNLAKGIENSTHNRMSEVIHQELRLPHALISTLSGPSHAEEVAADIPTAVVAGGVSDEVLEKIQHSFSNNNLRVYKSTDLIGVELGGSLKNIIAIAAGICHGLKMGDNTMGALITRGLAEMSRLGVTMGAQADTFAGLSGIGDLITTCMSRHSRNRFVGEHIGMGEKLDDILAGMSMIAEGVKTTKSGYELAKKYDVEMPITTEVYEVLFNNKPPEIALGELMRRELKSEVWQ